jgi:cell division protein FtsB
MKGHAKIDSETPESESDTPEAPASEVAETKDGEISKKVAPKMSRPMHEIRLGEDQALKDYLDLLGPDGSIRVRIVRDTPRTIRVNGRDYSTHGHLDTVNECVDEEYLSREYGGGTYNLTITSRRKSEGGSFKYAGHRQIVVAGDPKIEKLPTNATQPATAPAQAPSGEPLMKEVVGLLKDELSHAREVKPEGISPAVQLLIDQMREDARRRDRDLEQLRRDLAVAQNQKPPEDTFKDKLLSSLVDGESGRIVSIRAQHESELRSVKEGHLQEIRLIEDRHDRAVKQMQQSHELMLASLKASYEREIAALNTSHQVTAAATTTTSSVTITTLNADIKRLEREVDTLRAENKDLRDRKDKPLLEQLKEMKTLKDAFSEDGDGDSSTADKVIAAVPAAIESIGGLIQMGRGQAAQLQPGAAQQPQAQQPAKPRVAIHPKTGERFVQRGNQIIPAKPKPKLITTDAGEQIEVPKIEGPTLALIITMLEAAFGRDEDPAIIAQTSRAQIPPDILAWIQQHHTDQVSGVDLFMSKVAKLPGTSPLASQLGRVWLRKVGAALIGE